MCGLVGVLDSHGHGARFEERLDRALAVLRHRGPDDEGCFFDGPLALGFRRLSILDLSTAGHQPMTSRDGCWTVAFNGEVYNHAELRKVLEGRGIVFRSTCDTEVLVEALAAWGPSCFERFNGMWAVLAWHRPTSTLIACRDPWGIKPLYMCQQAGWTGFASEIKGLSALGCEVGGVDPAAARRFIDDGELDTDTRTFFAHVERLAPGILYRFRADRPEPERQPYRMLHVDVPRFADHERGEAEFVDAFRSAFLSAVHMRLRVDVDVGTCLSGGLDSTAIACAAARFFQTQGVPDCRYAFTALFPEYDESAFIRPVIDQTGARWYSTVIDDEQIRQEAPRFFAAHDEPVHSLSPLAGFIVMGLAVPTPVRVLLNGQGADELLAGYSSTVVPYLRSLTSEDGVFYAIEQAVAHAGGLMPGLALVARAQAGLLARALPPELELSLRRLRVAPGVAADGAPLLPEDGALGPAQAPRWRASADLRPTLDEGIQRQPLPLYLRIEDVNSSAFSLEARLPFLDPVLVAMAAAAPARVLRRDGLNKYLLRRILPGLVPDVVWKRRDKMGFPVPQGRWLRGPLRDMLTETLSETRLQQRGWYRARDVTRMLETFLAGPPSTPPPGRLVRVLLLERWARDHLDR